MKTLFLLFALLPLSCSAPNYVLKPDIVPSKAMSLVNRYSFGQACPVNGQILTAAHVASITLDDALDSGEYALSYSYSMRDRSGVVSTDWSVGYRDLAGLAVDRGDEPYFHELAATAPQVGDDVHWYEFLLAGVGVLNVVERHARVTSITAGHVTFSEETRPGASGGCLFDSSDAVVGVVKGRLQGEGVAVQLNGAWWPDAGGTAAPEGVRSSPSR